MYEDILDDPEVQEIVDKYEGNHKNDLPLDGFGKPLEVNDDDDASQLEENDNKDDSQKDDKKDSDDDASINEDSLDEFIEEVPEIDYTPQTEFAKTLDLSKIDDGFQKYVLTHLEPITLSDKDGKQVIAYTADDIPKDFEFADQLEATKVSTALARLDAEGTALRKEFEDTLAEIDQINSDIEAKQAQLDGLTDAINNGEFPKLELDEDGNIDKNSKVNQLADDIISYQQEANEGRSASRAISFDTALNRFQRENPDRFKDLDSSLSKEDAARQKYASRTSHSSQRTGKNSTVGKYDNLSREEFDNLLNDPDFDVANLFK